MAAHSDGNVVPLRSATNIGMVLAFHSFKGAK
jgi:hypothetical protein